MLAHTTQLVVQPTLLRQDYQVRRVQTSELQAGFRSHLYGGIYGCRWKDKMIKEKKAKLYF